MRIKTFYGLKYDTAEFSLIITFSSTYEPPAVSSNPDFNALNFVDMIFFSPSIFISLQYKIILFKSVINKLRLRVRLKSPFTKSFNPLKLTEITYLNVFTYLKILHAFK